MAWNGLGSGKDGSLETFQHKSCGRSGSRRRGRRAALVCLPIAALAIVACICIALFRGEKRTLGPEAQGKSHLIADVGTNTVARQSVTNATPTVWPKKNPNRADGIWRHGEGPRSIAVTNGIEVTYPNDPSVRLLLPRPQDKLPFNNLPDNEIASVLSIKPGESAIIVPLPYDFDQRFIKSLSDPITIDDDDSPEQIALKERVIEARKVLADALGNGESPRDILMEERKNLNRLMHIRDNYNRIVREQIANGASDKEIVDTVEAANLLLEKEGIANPIRLPYREKIRLRKKGMVK